MADIVWRPFRTRQAYIGVGSFVEDVRRGMQEEVIPLVLEECEYVVRSWKRRPEFYSDVRIMHSGISVFVRPTGGRARVWQWLSNGVSRQFIAPRNRGRMAVAFRAKYLPITSFYSYSGPGLRAGDWVFSKGHWWPGIMPRNFEGRIADTIVDDFRVIAEKILRRAVNRARQGRP